MPLSGPTFEPPDQDEPQTAQRIRLPADAALRMVEETGRLALYRTTARGELLTNPALNRLLGFEPDARPTFPELDARMPGQLRRLQDAAFAALELGGRLFEAEICCKRALGDERWFLVRGELLFEADGAPGGSIGVLVDITDRKRAEDSLRLMAREADHRAANLLTVLQGIVSLAGETEAAELKEAITGRVLALARAHKLLTSGRWAGAHLRRLVEEETAPYTHGHPEKVRLSGPDRALTHAEAQALAMAFHELATNAAKYGALSNAGGRVDVSWTEAAGNGLTITWSETGGPPVEPPTRRGFGTVMITRALAEALGAHALLDWNPSGLTCTLEVPGKAE
jgi:two-component sensor histidine kinase